MQGIYKKLFLFVMLMLLAITAIARPTDYYGRFWGGAFISGVIGDSKFLYDGGTEVRLFNRNGNVYQLSLLLGALGYRVSPSVLLWLGYTALPILGAATNRMHLQNRIWQQMSWVWFNQENFTLVSRSRIEERQRTDQAEWSWRFRQRFTVIFPKIIAHKVGIGVFDELFFYLNKPSWISNDTLGQNRFFAGIILPVANHVDVWVGYLNLYRLHTPVNRMDHIFYLTLNFNLGVLDEPD